LGVNAELGRLVSADASSQSRDVAIIGAGPAGLFAAEILGGAGHRVTIYERMPSPARKFLLAGRGGLNLTHSEPLQSFLKRYGERASQIRAVVEEFPPEALVAWANELGAETFVGTSGRVFPRAMKASPLLRAWLRRLAALGVEIRTPHQWTGFAPSGALKFSSSGGAIEVAADAVLLALGGASWPRLGSDGTWVEAFDLAGIGVSPLMPANCGVLVPWSDVFRSRFEGAALKRIALSAGGTTTRGEAIVTQHGLEGGAIYSLVPMIREAIRAHGEAALAVDLKPDLDVADISKRLSQPRRGATLSNFLRKSLNLDPAAIGLLREAAIPESLDTLAARIKAVPLRVAGLAPLEHAISTAGGVAWTDLDSNLMIRARPGVFVAGEMLDFEAPTGGYLLQGTIAPAVRDARGMIVWLEGR
jgi:uncharacterized flavoprotein (TIGR03862 family)